jgi:hypothetical protein
MPILVTQKDEWGCGIACVASLLGISYRSAKARLQRANHRRINFAEEGLNVAPIIAVVRKAGIEVKRHHSLKSWPEGTIVFLSDKVGVYKGTGHYLLKTSRGWMDPWGSTAVPKAQYRKHLPRTSRVEVGLVPVEYRPHK